MNFLHNLRSGPWAGKRIYSSATRDGSFRLFVTLHSGGLGAESVPRILSLIHDEGEKKQLADKISRLKEESGSSLSKR